MKVTDLKAAQLLIDRKEGRASSNTRVFERDGVYCLELFGNVIAWHYNDGTIQVRPTVHSYTTHMRLNALAYLLNGWKNFHVWKCAGVNYTQCNGETFEDQPMKVHCIRGAQ